MSLQWITINKTLETGIRLINALQTKRFALLLTHITEKIESNNREIFSDEELEKLKDMLKLDDEQLQILLQSIAHIYKQASKVVLKPTTFQKQLIDDFKIDAEKAEEFVKVYSQETTKIFGNFEERYKLKDVAWELDLEVANSFGNKLKKPKARIQLSLDQRSESGSDIKEKILMEMGKDELVQLYGVLEGVQAKLDNIIK